MIGTTHAKKHTLEFAATASPITVPVTKFGGQPVWIAEPEWPLSRETGVSNGAFMSNRLAAEASDMIAAIAPVIGEMAPSIADEFGPQHPVSVLIIQGDADPLVPIEGGGVGFGRTKRGQTVPTKDTLGRYLKLNGNKGKPTVTKIDGDPADGTTVELTKYPDGPTGFTTYYCLVKNGGHAWPGRPQYMPEALIGKASQDLPIALAWAEHSTN